MCPMMQLGQYWFLCPLVFFGLMLAVFFVARRYIGLPCSLPGRASEPQEPGEILRVRYAKGEIDRDTFERMKKDLSL